MRSLAPRESGTAGRGVSGQFFGRGAGAFWLAIENSCLDQFTQRQQWKRHAIRVSAGSTFAAVAPSIRSIAAWPRVNAPVYVVVVGALDQPLRQMTISGIPKRPMARTVRRHCES